jgi:catechol 2,3-dioxygenase-like lactoylglutathione lyase family enzyme
MITVARYGTGDLTRATGFYDAICSLLGVVRAMERPGMVGYKGAEGSMFIIGTPFAGEAAAGNGNQIVVNAASRAVVDAVHAKALEMGGSDEGAPGIRGDDPNGFYGAYFRDPDGNKLCVCRFGPPD